MCMVNAVVFRLFDYLKISLQEFEGQSFDEMLEL